MRHCDGTELSIDWHATWSSSSIHDLKRCDLTVTLGSTSTFTFTKQKSSIRHGWTKGIRWCLIEFGLYTHFWLSYELKTKPWCLGHWPDLWGHRLIWDLKFRYQLLCLVTADMLVFFCEALAQLGEKQRGRSPPPPAASYRSVELSLPKAYDWCISPRWRCRPRRYGSQSADQSLHDYT